MAGFQSFPLFCVNLSLIPAKVEEGEGGEENIVGITVGFAPLGAMEANYPCLIKVGSPVCEFTVDGVKVEEADPGARQRIIENVESGAEEALR